MRIIVFDLVICKTPVGALTLFAILQGKLVKFWWYAANFILFHLLFVSDNKANRTHAQTYNTILCASSWKFSKLSNGEFL